MKDIKLIVGLGNPGEKYEKTRHNSGFMVVDLLHKKLDFEPFHEEKKFNAELSGSQFEDGKHKLFPEKIILAKPLTFMNLSGEAVAKILHYYKIPLDDFIVVYDDLDTVFGEIRIRKKGGPGTHNGMKSLVEALGENFPRLRFGIENRTEAQKKGLDASSSFVSSTVRLGRTRLRPPKMDSASFVLSAYAAEEQATLKKALKHAVEAICVWLKKGADEAMNKYN